MRFIFIVLSLISVKAFAVPRVGDSIHRGGMIQSGRAFYPLSEDVEVIDVTAAKVTVRTTTVRNHGTPVVLDKIYPISAVLGHEEVLQLLSHCLDLGGIRGPATFAGVTFDTCAIETNSNGCGGKVWLAEVPMGAVASDNTCAIDGGGITRTFIPDTKENGGELTYKWGQVEN
jgi:hypothetical protein